MRDGKRCKARPFSQGFSRGRRRPLERLLRPRFRDVTLGASSPNDRGENQRRRYSSLFMRDGKRCKARRSPRDSQGAGGGPLSGFFPPFLVPQNKKGLRECPDAARHRGRSRKMHQRAYSVATTGRHGEANTRGPWARRPALRILAARRGQYLYSRPQGDNSPCRW